MDTRSYDLNLKSPFDGALEFWKEWEDKPESPDLRLGLLGEVSDHPDFIETLGIIKPSRYFTSGRILGTPGDPRRTSHIDATLESGSGVILRWSDTPYCRRAFGELQSQGISVTLHVGIEREEDLRKFWDEIWDEESDFILSPELDINSSPKIILTPDDLKDRKNVKTMKYYQGILLTNKKIIITKDSINLKPIKVYDRV